MNTLHFRPIILVKVSCLFFLLILKLNASSQTNIHKGYIYNSKGHPVVFAKIKSCEKINYTDSVGYFEFKTQEENCNLLISHINYSSAQIQSNSDTLNKIYLKEKILTKVNILGKLTNQIKREKNEFFIDYTFQNYSLILLSKTKEGKKLSLIEGNTRKYALPITSKCTKIITDRLGNIYLESKDSLFQISIQPDKTLYLFNGLSKSNYENIVNDLVIINEHNSIWIQTDKHKQSTTIYRKETVDSQSIIIYSTVDQNQKEFIQHTQANIRNNPAFHMMGEVYPGGDGKHNSDLAFDKVEESLWLETIVLKEPNNPIFNIKDTLFLFDHINSSIIRFNQEGKWISSTKINYHLKPNWSGELIVDHYLQHIYALNIDKGVYTIQKINLLNGEIFSSFELFGYSFPINFKINNGYAYFLSKESKTSSRYELMKIELSD